MLQNDAGCLCLAAILVKNYRNMNVHVLIFYDERSSRTGSGYQNGQRVCFSALGLCHTSHATIFDGPRVLEGATGAGMEKNNLVLSERQATTNLKIVISHFEERLSNPGLLPSLQTSMLDLKNSSFLCGMQLEFPCSGSY